MNAKTQRIVKIAGVVLIIAASATALIMAIVRDYSILN